MEHRALIILGPIQTTRVNQDCKTIGIEQQRYFSTKVNSREFGQVSLIVWENSNKELFDQIAYDTHHLADDEYPHKFDVITSGIIRRVEIPTYILVKPQVIPGDDG